MYYIWKFCRQVCNRNFCLNPSLFVFQFHLINLFWIHIILLNNSINYTLLFSKVTQPPSVEEEIITLVAGGDMQYITSPGFDSNIGELPSYSASWRIEVSLFTQIIIEVTLAASRQLCKTFTSVFRPRSLWIFNFFRTVALSSLKNCFTIAISILGQW